MEQGLHVGFPLDAGAVLLIELEGVREGFAEAPAATCRWCWTSAGATARSVRTATAAKERTPSGEAARPWGPWGAWPPTTTSTTGSSPLP